jgi:hypothetical protein
MASVKRGVVVDVRDPRRAMIEAGWGGQSPDTRKRRRRRKKDHPIVEALKKLGLWKDPAE